MFVIKRSLSKAIQGATSLGVYRIKVLSSKISIGFRVYRIKVLSSKESKDR